MRFSPSSPTMLYALRLSHRWPFILALTVSWCRSHRHAPQARRSRRSPSQVRSYGHTDIADHVGLSAELAADVWQWIRHERPGLCSDGVRRRQWAGTVRGRRLHDRGRSSREWHRKVERIELVSARKRDERKFLPSVRALAVFDDGSGPALYAGGDFTTAGGVAANRIAKWNGSSWSQLGSG